jgi:hypothetical protein
MPEFWQIDSAKHVFRIEGEDAGANALVGGEALFQRGGSACPARSALGELRWVRKKCGRRPVRQWGQGKRHRPVGVQGGHRGSQWIRAGSRSRWVTPAIECMLTIGMHLLKLNILRRTKRLPAGSHAFTRVSAPESPPNNVVIRPVPRSLQASRLRLPQRRPASAGPCLP